MAREVQRFSVFIPSGTAKANPLQVSLAMPARVVEEVEIVIPPGPRGEVGFQLGSSGTQIIPATPGQFVVTDNEIIHWPLEGQIDSGAWQMIVYNTGTFNHAIEVRFLVQLVPGRNVSPGFQPLPAGVLDGG